MNPLNQLTTFGQSIWLDYIRRDLIESGDLKKLILQDDLKGVTSNPSIFEKSIAESDEYTIHGNDANTIYETLTQKDVRDAAHEFSDLYQQTQGVDGYVSLEVNPHLAHDTEGTLIEARRLWKALDCPNVFIKIPATDEGLVAIQTLISEGININVTLLFGIPRYQQVHEAYIAGLEQRAAKGDSLANVTSVASFFISRIDSLIDPMLDKDWQGEVAIASAKIAYQSYLDTINSDRFKKLVAQGAKVQRLLWASTSAKNPAYSDVKYIDALIGVDTVNTIPMETLNAYRDHGDPQDRLEDDVDQAHAVFQQLQARGIDIDKLTQQLEDDGVAKFKQAYNELIDTIKKRMG